MGNWAQVSSLNKEVKSIHYTDAGVSMIARHFFNEADNLNSVNRLFEVLQVMPVESRVLVLGSGMNTAISELEDRFPSIDLISLDFRYAHPGMLKPAKSNNLLSADWYKLPLASNSINLFLCHHSFSYWIRTSSDLELGMREVDRVSAVNGSMYFTGYDQTNTDTPEMMTSRTVFTNIARKLGWNGEIFEIDQEMDGSVVFGGHFSKR